MVGIFHGYASHNQISTAGHGSQQGADVVNRGLGFFFKENMEVLMGHIWEHMGTYEKFRYIIYIYICMCIYIHTHIYIYI